MKHLFLPLRAILLDLVSTIAFFLLYGLSKSLAVSLGAGMALAMAQIGWALHRGKRVDALQWTSLVVVLASGAATLWSSNLLFMKLQPSAIYLLVGAVMLRPNWMARYVPDRAMRLMSDLVWGFGYVWAGLMFVSAALNLTLAFALNVMAWGAAMSAWATGSKLTLCLLQFAVMKRIGRARRERIEDAGGTSPGAMVPAD